MANFQVAVFKVMDSRTSSMTGLQQKIRIIVEKAGLDLPINSGDELEAEYKRTYGWSTRRIDASDSDHECQDSMRRPQRKRIPSKRFRV